MTTMMKTQDGDENKEGEAAGSGEMRRPVLVSVCFLQEGQQDGSVGKGAYHQTQRLELHL